MKRVLMGVTFLVAAAGVAAATTMVPLDLKRLTERADRVVLATVEASEAHWTGDHDAIYTDVTLRVTRVYKGAAQAGDAVVVRREGGTVDGIGMHVYGAATFTVGEEALVFVEKRGAASYVVGMAQGKLRVTTLADGKKQVAPSLAEIHFVAATATPPGPRPLEDVERDLARLVAQGARK
jgi:hypothetical protein